MLLEECTPKQHQKSHTFRDSVCIVLRGIDLSIAVACGRHGHKELEVHWDGEWGCYFKHNLTIFNEIFQLMLIIM